MNAVDQKIILEIKGEVSRRKIQVTSGFISFYLNLLKLDPNVGLSSGNKTYGAVENLIKSTAKKIVDGHFEVITIQMQFFQQNSLSVMRNLYVIKRNELNLRLNTLRVMIIEPYTQDPNSILPKLICYIALASGMGNPKEPNVKKEIDKVLASISIDKHLKRLYSLPYFVRDEILMKIVKLSSGIRLFNMDCGLGGAGIKPLPQLLESSIELLKFYIERDLQEADTRISAIENNLNACYVVSQLSYRVVLIDKIPESSSKSELLYYEGMLVAYHQFKIILREKLTWIDKFGKEYYEYLAVYDKILKDLHSKITRGAAVATDVVFPLFEDLYQAWKSFQEITYYLVAFKSIFMKHRQLMDEMRMNEFMTITLNPAKPDVQLDAQEFGKPIPKGVQIIKNYHAVKLEFQGFCCWKLVLTNGFLVKGDPTIGLVMYRGKFYAFSSILGLNSFARDPQYYIKRIVYLSRKTPCFIYLLGIKELLKDFLDITPEDEEPEVLKISQSTQTDLHPIPSYKDNDYEWNIWNIKRKAFKMLDLYSKKTTGMQTKDEQNKVMSTQTWGVKCISTQTKSDSCGNTSVERVRYFYGLRGRKDDKQFMLDLTMPDNKSDKCV